MTSTTDLSVYLIRLMRGPEVALQSEMNSQSHSNDYNVVTSLESRVCDFDIRVLEKTRFHKFSRFDLSSGTD